MSLKKAHQLRSATLQAKSIEKTSVKLAVSVFCDSTRDALYFNSEHEGKTAWRGTTEFISLNQTVERHECQHLLQAVQGKTQSERRHNGPH